MNYAELTAALTAAANIIAAQLTNTQTNQLGAIFTLLGELLQTIAVIRPDDSTSPLQDSNPADQGDAASSQGQGAAQQGDDPAATGGNAAAQSGGVSPPTATT